MLHPNGGDHLSQNNHRAMAAIQWTPPSSALEVWPGVPGFRIAQQEDVEVLMYSSLESQKSELLALQETTHRRISSNCAPSSVE
jgi:hypothetical protein